MIETQFPSSVRLQSAHGPFLSLLNTHRCMITPLLAAAVVALSAVDGLATLWLLAEGVHEANPVMRALLTRGPALFLAAKLAVTGLGVAVMLAARGRPLLGTSLRAGHVLLILAVIYCLVVAYEIALWFLLTF